MMNNQKLINIRSALIAMFIFALFFTCSSDSPARDFKGAEYRSIENFTYGRFETRMIAPGADGVLSSMFTYHEISDLADWNEIDIEVLGRYENAVQFNAISPSRTNHVGSVLVDFVPSAEFHIYAFEWTPDYLAWFIDNVEVYRQTDAHVQKMNLPQKFMMNIWNPVHDNWVGPWNPNVLPVFAYYDWAKYASYTPGTGNTGTDDNFTSQWHDNFDTWDESRWEKATHTFDGNNCDFLPDNAVITDGNLILCLTDDVNTGFTDKNSPVVLSARGYENEIIVKFSEKITRESAEKASNYVVSGVNISSASLLPGDSKVQLFTSTLDPEATYNLIVLGIKDISANGNLLTGSVTNIKMNMEKTFPLKINFGDADYEGYQRAQNWTPEVSHGYMDGIDVIWPPGTNINNTDDDLLYQTERQALIKYGIRLDNGTYDIKFMFSENKWDAAGIRLFDVYAEGKKVISNLDIFDKAGKNAAYDIVVENVDVQDHELNIHFTSLKGEAVINAIEISQNPSSLHRSNEIQKMDYWIAQNYPNPFNSQTTFEFNLPVAAHVHIDIFDIRGTLVDTLGEQDYPAGHYKFRHDFSIASGIYFYKFNVRSDVKKYQSMGKMILLK
jgi:hypothetical protein